MELMDWLTRAAADGASDVFFIAGGPVCERVGAKVAPMGGERLSARDSEGYVAALYRRADRSMHTLRSEGDDLFSFAAPGVARFRVSTYFQRGSMAAVVRVVAFGVPSPEERNIPPEIVALANAREGLVLLTGAAGSGKSTTAACLVGHINRTRETHILTFENPIEYLHRDQKSLVSQREIGIDAPDFAAALRAGLRQSPDIVMLGELQGAEAVQTALTAAEGGRLVIAIQQTRSAAAALERLRKTGSPAERDMMREQLSEALLAVVGQRLLPAKGGGLVPAFELLRTSPALRDWLRGDGGPLPDTGWEKLDDSLKKLYHDGKISRETALEHAKEPEILKTRL